MKIRIFSAAIAIIASLFFTSECQATSLGQRHRARHQTENNKIYDAEAFKSQFAQLETEIEQVERNKD